MRATVGRYPTLNLTTRLMDAHVYVFRRQVLDLMMTKDPKDLDSIREDVVPWLVKGGWQEGLRRQWKESESPHQATVPRQSPPS